MGKYRYFRFSRQLVWIGSVLEFQPVFCGLWFQYQFYFKAFTILFTSVLSLYLPTDSLVCGPLVFSVNSVFRVFGILIRSDPYIHSSRVSPEVHKQLYSCLSSSLSAISLILSIPLLVLWTKSNTLATLLYCALQHVCTHLQPSKQQEGGKGVRGSSETTFTLHSYQSQLY